MFLDDYGETVQVEVCNMLWQIEEKKEFQTVHEAWEYVKDKVENHFIKMQVRRDKDKKTLHRLKFFKIPESGTYLVSNTAWEGTVELKTPNEIYDALFNLVLKNEPS